MDNSIKRFVLPVFLLTIACDRPAASAQGTKTHSSRDSAKESKMKSAAKKAGKGFVWANGPCTSIDRVGELIGLTTAEIETILGRPERKEEFLLGDRPDEFHIVLQNTYPLTKAQNAKVKIEEWTWTSGPCRLTVWFHHERETWKSFESSRYSSTAEF